MMMINVVDDEKDKLGEDDDDNE